MYGVCTLYIVHIYCIYILEWERKEEKKHANYHPVYHAECQM